ncbi:MAG: GNAT family N-acetyltransferase, partial [Pseudomonadota bacterium]
PIDNPQTDILGQINFNSILRGAAQSCTVGYHLGENAEGRGLMTEAFDLAVQYMFVQRGLHRIVAKYIPENQRSARMLERLGFEIEGLARSDLFIGDAWRDHVVTAKINHACSDPRPGAAL